MTFNLASLNIVLPDEVVYTVAYNTSRFGYSPIGEGAACYTSAGGCGYDSLNVGLTPKDNLWMRFDVPRKFKNQGDCTQFVNTGK